MELAGIARAIAWGEVMEHAAIARHVEGARAQRKRQCVGTEVVRRVPSAHGSSTARLLGLAHGRSDLLASRRHEGLLEPHWRVVVLRSRSN